MSAPAEPPPGGGTEDGVVEGGRQADEAPAIDRKMLDDIFGDVLPDTTADEREPGHCGGHTQEWYRENRPPHHGG